MGQVKNNDSFLGKAEKLKPVLKHRMLRPVGVVSFERKKADSVVSALETAVRKGRAVEYVKGFSSERDEMTEEELKQACEAAAGADAVVIFAGLPDSFESEGYDRNSMELPKCQNRLIEAVAEIQKNVVVVLHNGSPVETPWAESVNAILEMYLGGEGIGEASDRLLFGEANPGGRLAETFPYRLEDNPSYLNFPGVMLEYK